MENKDLGRAAVQPGSRELDPQAVPALTGFDPSRWPAFNINHYVQVRLTDLGRRILRERNARYAGIFPHATWPMPDESAAGYSRWQLWDLIRIFGEHVNMGSPVPFDTTILLDASAIEARSGETGTGSTVGESAVPEADAPNSSPKEPKHV